MTSEWRLQRQDARCIGIYLRVYLRHRQPVLKGSVVSGDLPTRTERPPLKLAPLKVSCAGLRWQRLPSREHRQARRRFWPGPALVWLCNGHRLRMRHLDHECDPGELRPAIASRWRRAGDAGARSKNGGQIHAGIRAGRCARSTLWHSTVIQRRPVAGIAAWSRAWRASDSGPRHRRWSAARAARRSRTG